MTSFCWCCAKAKGLDQVVQIIVRYDKATDFLCDFDDPFLCEMNHFVYGSRLLRLRCCRKRVLCKHSFMNPEWVSCRQRYLQTPDTRLPHDGRCASYTIVPCMIRSIPCSATTREAVWMDMVLSRTCLRCAARLGSSWLADLYHFVLHLCSKHNRLLFIQ